MTGADFTELVEWIQDRWGRHDEVWANSSRFARDFEGLPAEDVWSALFAKGNGQWAPRPPELVGAATELWRSRLRNEGVPVLEAPKGASWSEWCEDQFGRVRSFGEVIRDRHAELFSEGSCRSPVCDVHRSRREPA